MNDALLPLQIKMYAYNAFPVPLAARLAEHVFYNDDSTGTGCVFH